MLFELYLILKHSSIKKHQKLSRMDIKLSLAARCSNIADCATCSAATQAMTLYLGILSQKVHPLSNYGIGRPKYFARTY